MVTVSEVNLRKGTERLSAGVGQLTEQSTEEREDAS